MDHSLVQQILDHANTRGTAIFMRTIREMIRDRKTILVALVSLIPIILGLLWSNYLSEDENIEEVRITEVSDTGNIFCYMDVPNYLPNRGNYTFQGEILNRGDTVQQVSVNMTLGNSKQSVTGLRRTTGLMEIVPNTGDEEDIDNWVPFQFNISYDMEEFNEGATYIVIQLYVNNTLSSARLLPDEFDWRIIDFTQFDVADLIGRNMAVYTDSIDIRPIISNYFHSPDLSIEKESDIMPLTITYPSLISREVNSTLNCSIAGPLNGSRVNVEIYGAIFGMLDTHSFTFSEDLDEYNFTLILPPGFTKLGFDYQFLVNYRITYKDSITYRRNGMFFMDVMPDEYLELAENSTLVLSNDTLYTGDFGVPMTFVSDSLNTLQIHLVNNDIEDKRFVINITFWVNQQGVGYAPYNDTLEFMVPATGNLIEDITIPFYFNEEFDLSRSFPRLWMNFSIQVENEISEFWESGKSNIYPTTVIAGSKKVSLEATFTPSVEANIHLPEDISTSKEEYDITGTINNTGIIEKEFQVMMELQNHKYFSERFLVSAGEEKEFHILIPTDNHSTDFMVETNIEVYSSRTLLPEDAEAKTSGFINIISESHKERKVLENFLFVYVQLYMKFIVPMVAMVYGISLISQETERKTLALYLTTPITKIELILYKFGGYLVAMTTILTIPLILIYFSFSYVLSFHLMVYYLLLLGICIFDLFLAVAAYGAVFTTIGTIERRPVLIGLSYLMVWEVFMGSLGIFLTQYTLFYHIRCAVFPFVERYVPNALDSMGLTDLAGNDFTIPMEISMSVIILVVFVFLFFGINILASRDIH